MYYAQIMAGGMGKRMGNTPLPKQFLMLGSKPIIIHTIEKFLLNDKFDLIIISVPHSWKEYTQDILSKYKVQDDRIKIIDGGRERNDTLNLAINFIEMNKKISKDDVLMVHDAVRPFVSKKIIDDNLNAIKKFNAIDTVIPAFDTIVKCRDGLITEIPIRDEMFQGQTPQTFKISKFRECYDSLSEKDKSILTDSCKIMLLRGESIGIVDGDSVNLKITTKFDLKLAECLVKSGHAAC